MNITVYINGNIEALECDATLEQVINQLNLSCDGYVFTINNIVIPKSQWYFYQLNDGDRISLFQAIAGG